MIHSGIVERDPFLRRDMGIDKKRFGSWYYFAAFFVLGLITASLGPSLSSFSNGINRTLQELGILFPVRAGAYLFGAWLTGRLIDRIRGHALLVAGMLLMGVTSFFIPGIQRMWGLLAAMVIMGWGMGILDVGGNTLLLWQKLKDPGSAMNALHFFYGLGSFLSPLILAGAIQYTGGIKVGYVMYGIVFIPLVLLVLQGDSPQPPQEKDSDQVSFSLGKNRRTLILISVFFFLYVGVEVGFGGWIAAYGLKSDLTTAVTGAVLTSAYWGAFTAARLASVPLAARWKPSTLLILDFSGGLISLAVILVWPSSRVALWGGALGLGWSLASVFPTMLTFANRHLSLKGRETSWFFVSAGLGAMVTPWVLSRFVEGGSPVRLMQVLFIDLLFTCVLFGILIFGKRRVGMGRGTGVREDVW